MIVKAFVSEFAGSSKVTATANTISESPASLVAILRAAHLTGDRELEAAARSQLKDQFGMDVVFRQQEPANREVRS